MTEEENEGETSSNSENQDGNEMKSIDPIEMLTQRMPKDRQREIHQVEESHVIDDL